MEFGTGYLNPMDRGYEEHDHNHGHTGSQNSTNDVGVGIGDLGISMGLGPIRNIGDIGAKLRPGTKKLEFVFMGSGKGGAQGHTPGMYGLKQRQALQEMGKANKIDFTTHSTVGIYGLSGMDRGGSFSKQRRNESYQELKRAVEFAAEVGKGGPVVVHTGEFERPVSEATWNTAKGEYKDKFKMFSDEEETASYKVVDKRSGGLVQEARKNRNVTRPLWKRYNKEDEFWSIKGGTDSYTYTDEKGNEVKVREGDYIDYWGRKVPRWERVPDFDKKTGNFKTKEYGWKELEDEAIDMTEEARNEWRKWKAGKIKKKEFEESTWGRFAEEELKEEDVIVRPEEAYIIASLETSAANARRFALQYMNDFQESVDTIEKLREAKKFYEKYESTLDHKKRELLKREGRRYSNFVPPDALFPTQLIDQEIKNMQNNIKRAQEAASGQWAQAKESMETIKHIESAENYAIREAADAYAQAAVFAFRRTEQLKEKGTFKKPVAVALENLFPEHYGSHPDELIKLVEKSRHRMIEMLTDEETYDFSYEKAEELAKQHITTTLDTGHLNMWRKYWKPDPKKSIADNDKEFDKWQLSKVKEMVQKKMVGHVHIDDNYGYHDDHLAPGEGNTPVREMIKILKENGYDGEMIVEPGADYYNDSSGFHSVMKTWRNFGIPVYRTGSGVGGSGRTWESVGYGHFGQNHPPYFVINPYFPSEEWQSWSGVSMD